MYIMINRFQGINPYLAYYMNLDKPGVITRLQYRYRQSSIVYAIRNQLNNKVYVGSTNSAGLRFHNHLISGTPSNPNLQSDIMKYGLNHFVVYILEVVSYPAGMTNQQQRVYLHTREQSRMDLFAKHQLYNAINASRKLNPLL